MNATDNDFRSRIGRIEALIDEIERFADPVVQGQAREIVQALLEFHGAALANLVGQIAVAGPPGRAILEQAAEDELTSSLLLLHGLHPHDLETRVAQALDQVRPQLHTHGGDVELLGIDGDVVRLRMQGSCHGCPSSAATLRQTIETAIFGAAPDVASIEVEGVVEPANLSSLLPIVTLEPALAGGGVRRVNAP
ncbi:NifU family protein [Singulisphaera acidiphila]|uniref:Thioredoxin-like protein n=1 Tax=Singulisphaera acidiphila (strain ATCC BAA-1392 / DSM 18658 / VKM B-2454 / MOB10) TaxID=886293 RepID=L0DHE4_SINAD|nr:NifU family protein [Singulisphaera acidiphila]AGA28682.1 thioredoxin-like protein [Singulisphaera acidiphila DSM 18658]